MSAQIDPSQFGHGNCSRCGGTLWSWERVQGNTVCRPCRRKAVTPAPDAEVSDAE